jgi:hypothetical protein
MAKLAEWIPTSFVELYREGRFDYWGAPYESLSEQERADRLRTRRSKVLWWSNIEWDRTPEEIATFSGDDNLRPGLYPFAGDGMGGLYCWFPKWRPTKHAEPPILFVPRESDDAEVFARTFSECLLRCLLIDFANPGDDDRPLEARVETWDAHAGIILPFLPPEHAELLRRVRKNLSPGACSDADREIAQSIASPALAAVQPPTRYDMDVSAVGVDMVRDLYDKSIHFYRELVEEEGRTEFSAKLADAESSRDQLLGIGSA